MGIFPAIGLFLVVTVVILLIVRRVNPDHHDKGNISGGGSGSTWI